MNDFEERFGFKEYQNGDDHLTNAHALWIGPLIFILIMAFFIVSLL